MNLLYISPEFPPNYCNFLVQLKQAGVNVFAVGEADFFSMPEEARASLTWYVRTNLSNCYDVEKATDYLLNDIMLPRGFGSIDIVESHNEFWMRLEAFVNEKYGVKGISSPDLAWLKKKSMMKERFRSLGLPVAPGYVVRHLEDCHRHISEIGYPFVLKPNEGVGAQGVFKISNESQLAHYMSQIDTEYFMEQFVTGRMVTYDGLTDHSGAVIHENHLVYGNGVLENVQGKDTFFYVSRTVPEKLSLIGRRIVEAFGIKRKFFHFEFFETADGNYMPVEINARPPGGPILDMMNYSLEADLYRSYARMIAGLDPGIPPVRKHHVGFAGRKERAYRNPHEAILARFGHRMMEHGENPSLFWSGMGKYRYLFLADSDDELFEIREFILGVY